MKSPVNLKGSAAAMCCALFLLLTLPLRAAQLTIYTNDFESYSTVGTSVSDASDADPTGPEWNITDDTSLSAPTTAGAGVQVINWLAHSGTKSLLLRSATEAQISLPNIKTGTNYTLDFWTRAVRGPGDRNWYVILKGMGVDLNADDYFAYRTDRSATSSNIFYFDGIGAGPAFIATGVNHTDNQWQHHRIAFDTIAQTCNIFIDDMVTPVVSNGDLARPDVAVPTMIILRHEGNSANDGYAAIDDVGLSVDGTLVSLNTTFAEGFESYPARVAQDDDADPQGPWTTVEADGVGQGKVFAVNKVQVVDSSVVTPHSGSKCLKLEGGQRAGATLAWGIPPQSDVQITWWARVPEAIQSGNLDAVLLRMSLFGAEGGSTFAGDSALLAHGIRRQGGTNVGDGTSLLQFTTAWQDANADYTPDVWEEYRMTTHNSQGRYTIIKNPSSANPVLIVDRGALVGAAADWGPDFMVSWCTSNGTNHPPVYIDDIEIKSLVSNPAALGEPYSVTNYGSRFTNYTILSADAPVGKPVVDPRDNTTILFTTDVAGGGIYQAQKVSSGNWAIDPTPIVSGLDRPSGLTIETNGTLWWTHDFNMALMRLKWPWTSNIPETIISNFGSAATDDDPIDVTVAPANFSGSLGQPGSILVADRGADGDANNAVYVIDPATTTLNQNRYTNYLINPTGGGLGNNLTAIAPIPASGEVATLSEDGFLIGIDANGNQRFINAFNLWPLGGAASGVAIATDPIGGKIWAADDLLDEVWSIDAATGEDHREIGFPLVDPSRPDRQIDFHDPGMSFSPNGAFLVLSDGNAGGSRLIIFHNDAFATPSFAITNAVRVGQNFQINWQSGGAATYRVQRGTTVNNLQDIATGLTNSQYLDTNAPVGTAFYRVIATP